MEFSECQLLPYDCYFGYLLKYDHEIKEWIESILREIFSTATSNSSSSALTSHPFFKKYRQKYTLSSKYSPTTISSLPMECTIHIFSYLDSRSLCRSQCVCYEWNELSSIDSLWKKLCFESFHSLPEEFRFKKSLTMKEIYSAMYVGMHQTLYPKSSQKWNNSSIPLIFLFS